MLVDDPAPSPTATAPDPGPSFIPETKVFRIDPPPTRDGATPPTYADLIGQGKSPLPGSRPGSEKVLMHFHGRGDSRFVLPYQRSGELLWLLAGCTSEAPLTIRSFNVQGIVVARYDLDPCRAAEGGGGTQDSSSTFMEVWADPDIEYDITVISSDLGST